MGAQAKAHVVHFYERDADLVDVIVADLVDAWRAGAVAVLISTEPHRLAFEAAVVAAGVDVVAARRDGSLVTLDAADTVGRLVSHGQVDGQAFRSVVGGVMQRAAGTGRPVWAYGEMVALLWDAGDVLGAVELERLWNDLGQEIDFSLVCAYRASSVAAPGHAAALHEICGLHSEVFHAPATVEAQRAVQEFAP